MTVMGRIIAVEGIDGSGKNTQTDKLLNAFSLSGVGASKISFPQYGNTFFGGEVANYLNGEFGSIEQIAPKLSAMLYAGDRFECREEIINKSSDDSVLICDRYVYSNVAHQIAKVTGEKREELRCWIERLEFDVYKLPRPDLTIFLDVPPTVSSDLVLKKDVRSYTAKKKDLHEENDSYLVKVYNVFKELSVSEQDWVAISCFVDGKLLDECEIFSLIKKELAMRGFAI